jgi:hypothetical protein
MIAKVVKSRRTSLSGKTGRVNRLEDIMRRGKLLEKARGHVVF